MENPKVEPNPRRKNVTIVEKSKMNAIDVGQREIGPVSSAPRHLVDLYQQSKKGKCQHESHFTTELEAQERDDMNVDASGGDIQMGENEDNLLDDIDVFGDLQ